MKTDTRESIESFTRHDSVAMTRDMRAKWLWTNFTVMSLGLWLMTSPFTFGYAAGPMMWSDLASGLLLILLSAIALSPRFDFWGRWLVAVVGTWLQLAPLVFWAKSPAAYATDTLVGAIVIALSILVPMMPGMAHHMEMLKPGPEVPPRWSYNPSSWHQRAPLIGLALLGWFISRYLAAYQLGFTDSAWDPFFGQSTARVLTSKVSRSFPISDAGLGAFAYTFEMLMGWMGGATRWRSMPWMVTFFFILVVPLGLVHITLVILQPVAVGAWCTLCLAAAFVMLLMIPLAVDEVVAMGQFLRASVNRGRPFWKTFWVGGTLQDEENKDERTPAYGQPPGRMLGPMFWGVSFPWTLVVAATAGLWLMVAPALSGTVGAMAHSDQVAGAVIITIAVISMGEVVRPMRFLNILPGLWVIAAPWIVGGIGPEKAIGVVTGGLVLGLSIPRGRVKERYGDWDRIVV